MLNTFIAGILNLCRHRPEASLLKAIVVVTAQFLFSAAYSDTSPFLSASGQSIRNNYGQGDIIPLRGVNLGSWLIKEPWMCPMDSSGALSDDWSARQILTQRFGATTATNLLATYESAWLQSSDFDKIAALGMNVVRLPFWYVNVLDDSGNWRSNAFTQMDWCVQQAWQRGIYTIIDLHGAPGGQTANNNDVGKSNAVPELWIGSNRAANQAQMVQIWQHVSAHYRGNPAVAGYDLLNEPQSVPSSLDLWTLLDSCYKTVRTNDPDHMIIMEATYGNWNFDMLPDPGTYGWTNVIYQLHLYPWSYWNDVSQVNAATDNAIQDWNNHSSWNVPCYIGEFNMGDYASWNYAIAKYSTAGASWSMWTYKSTYTGYATSWGIYNLSGNQPTAPNLVTDSANTISNRWAQFSTDASFHLNASLRAALAMPIAADDAYQAVSNQTLTVSAPGVLGNDSDQNLGDTGIALKVQLITGPIHGSFSLNTNTGSFTYTPTNSSSGNDSFRYKVWDGRIDSVRIATVSIQIGTNRLSLESKADGTGTNVPSLSLAAGSTLTLYAIVRNNSGAFITNTPASWSLTNGSGGIVNTDLVIAGDAKSATFTAHQIGSASILATGGNLAIQSGTISVIPGQVSQLLWTTQPGLATNGFPLGRQPVVQTTDPFSNPSTNGLPRALNLTVTTTGGTGSLTGTTNYNIGTTGSNGVVSLNDLKTGPAGTTNQLLASVATIPPISLLTNGTFSLSNSTGTPSNWTTWVFGGGYANRELLSPSASVKGNYDGSFQMTLGAASTTGGGGVFQIVPAAAALNYTLSASSGVQNWWWPTGEMRLFFLDANNNFLQTNVLSVSSGILSYDTGKAYQPYQMSRVAPAGTTQAKVEFAGFGGGSVWFDNAALLESGSVASLVPATTLPFVVYAPASQTNAVTGIISDKSGIFKLNFIGTPGVTYQVQTTSNLMPPVIWQTVVGSDNTVTNSNGLWFALATNSGPQCFYRSVVANP